jgi:hypothetical protein
MTITSAIAIAIAIVGSVLYVICFSTVTTKVASIPARPTASRLPAATARQSSSRREGVAGGQRAHVWTFTGVTGLTNERTRYA